MRIRTLCRFSPLWAMLFLLISLNLFAQAPPSLIFDNSFDGLGAGVPAFIQLTTVPDANGAAGSNDQYVQGADGSYAVFSKSTGAVIQPPTAGNTLFASLDPPLPAPPHPCHANNDGSPLVKFDQLADRWVITQFTHVSGPVSGFMQCVAISQTNDATGAFNPFVFNYGQLLRNDSPRLAIWNDNYYITYNMVVVASGAPAGVQICALDRATMLGANPPQAPAQVCSGLPTSVDIIPADLEGPTAPPPGSPAYFMGTGANSLNLWQLSNINFAAGTSTLSGPVNIPVAPFSPVCVGAPCILQPLAGIGAPPSPSLDAPSPNIMHRLVYRNFPGPVPAAHEALVASQSVFSGATSGVRWYEIQNPSAAAPTLVQQQTFAPDATFRFMSSTAMDSLGNIALGYNVSDGISIFPGIALTGRAAGDPVNTMGAEQIVQNGGGAMLAPNPNWGTFNNLAMDPSDDCTFWHTAEYMAASGGLWSTRIAHFKFTNCGPDFSISTSPSTQFSDPNTNANYTISLTPANGFAGAATLAVTGLPAGATSSFSAATVASGAPSTLTISTTAATPVGSYPLTISATSGLLVRKTTVTLNAGTDFTLSVAPAAQSAAPGQSAVYAVTVNPINGFNTPVNFSLSPTPAGTTATFSPASGSSSTLTISVAPGTPTSVTPLTISGVAGNLTRTAPISLLVSDFTSNVTPSTLAVNQGTSGNYSVVLNQINGYSGLINLSASGLPPGVTFTPVSVSLPPAPVTALLPIAVSAATAVGNYPVSIDAFDGTTTHSSPVTLSVVAQDFTVTATPASQTVSIGTNAGYAVVVSAQNGFTGVVSLSATIAPAGANSPAVTINPTSLNNSGTANLTAATSITTTPGAYVITITATSGGLIHTSTVTLTVNPPPGDFSITATSSVTIKRGKSGSVTVTVASIGGFAGTVQFSVSGLPTGVTAKFTPTSVTPSGNSTLTFTVGNSVKQGGYPLTVTGSSGLLNHSTGVLLQVN